MPRRNARNFALFAAILCLSWTSFGTLIIHTIIPHWGTNLFARTCLSRDFQNRRVHLGQTRHRRRRRRRLRWTDDGLYGHGDRAASAASPLIGGPRAIKVFTELVDPASIEARPRPVRGVRQRQAAQGGFCDATAGAHVVAPPSVRQRPDHRLSAGHNRMDRRE